MAANRRLTPKQATFVEQYLLDLNATQAAIRAGYSTKTAGQIGEKLLKKAEIESAIDALKAERSARTMIGADRVLIELAKIAFGDVRAIFNADGTMKPLSEISDEAAAMIAALEVSEIRDRDGVVIGYNKKIRLSDKLRALELLGRHVGLFDQKITVDGDKENPLTVLIKSIQGSSFNPVIINGGKAA
jgi:phage terminase small subunit